MTEEPRRDRTVALTRAGIELTDEMLRDYRPIAWVRVLRVPVRVDTPKRAA